MTGASTTVEETRLAVEYFVNQCKTTSPEKKLGFKRKSNDSNDEGAPPAKVQRNVYKCPFCKEPFPSSYFKRHVEYKCTVSAATSKSLEDRTLAYQSEMSHCKGKNRQRSQLSCPAIKSDEISNDDLNAHSNESVVVERSVPSSNCLDESQESMISTFYNFDTSY